MIDWLTHGSRTSTGRGILTDDASYSNKKGIVFNSFSSHEVKLAKIQDIVKEYNSTIQKGDLLFLRAGITHDWDNKMSFAEKTEYVTKAVPELVGVEPLLSLQVIVYRLRCGHHVIRMSCYIIIS